jgi:hypothetical protein
VAFWSPGVEAEVLPAGARQPRAGAAAAGARGPAARAATGLGFRALSGVVALALHLAAERPFMKLCDRLV